MLIELLERRLDAVVYRMKLVPTVFAARQFVNHGHVKVNGRRVNIPSYQVRDGDVIRLDAEAGRLDILVDPAEFHARMAAEFRPNRAPTGLGRELFDLFRMNVSSAATGASPFNFLGLRS
jgi:ribosomal protein S4